MNEAAKEAVRERVALGYTKEQILQELVAAGYPNDEATVLYETVVAAATAAPDASTSTVGASAGQQVTPADASAAATQQRVGAQAAEDDMVKAATAADHADTTRPEAASSSGETEFLSPRRLVGLLVLFLVLGCTIAGVAYAALFGGFGSLHFSNPLQQFFAAAPYETAEGMMSGLIENQQSLTAYGVNLDYHFVIESRASATPAINNELLPSMAVDNLGAVTAAVPAEVDARFTASGLVDNRNEDDPEMDVTFNINMLAEPLILNGAGNMRAADGILYGKIDDMPANLSAFVEGIPMKTWIILYDESSGAPALPESPSLPIEAKQTLKLLPTELLSVIGQELHRLATLPRGLYEHAQNSGLNQLAQLGASPFGVPALDTNLSEEELMVMKRSAELLVEHPILRLADEPTEVTVTGEDVYAYTVAVDYDNLRSYFLNLIKEAETITGETLPLTEGELTDLLPSREVVTEFNRLVDLALHFRADGTMAGLRVATVFTVDHPEVTKQFRFNVAVDTTRQNDALDITAPEKVHPDTLEEIMEQQMEKMLSDECGGGAVCESITEARVAGGDAAVKSSLSTMRSIGELSYNENALRYSDVCADTRIQQQIMSIVEHHQTQTIVAVERDSTSGPGKVVCNDQEQGYAVAAPLASDASVIWCVDSTGVIGEVSPDALASSADISCGFE